MVLLLENLFLTSDLRKSSFIALFLTILPRKSYCSVAIPCCEENAFNDLLVIGFKMFHKQYTLYSGDPQKGTVCHACILIRIQKNWTICNLSIPEAKLFFILRSSLILLFSVSFHPITLEDRMRYASLILLFLSSLTFSSQGELKGYVHNQKGQPVSGVVVSIPMASVSCTTGTDGHFTFYSTAIGKKSSFNKTVNTFGFSNNSLVINNIEPQKVTLTIFDLKGRKIINLYDDILKFGQHRFIMPLFLRNQTVIANMKTGSGTESLRIAGMFSYGKNSILNDIKELSPAIEAGISTEFEIRVSHPLYDEMVIRSHYDEYLDITIHRKLKLTLNDTIRIGDTLSLSSNGISLSLDSIRDQRCDCDVLCDNAGNAFIYLTLTVNGSAHQVQLETYNRLQLSVGGYSVAFVSLNPCRQDLPKNYLLEIRVSLMEPVLFLEHFKSKNGTLISGNCWGLKIDFPTYQYNSTSNIITNQSNLPLTDSTKLIYGGGVSLTGAAGGGIASSLYQAFSLPFTSYDNVKIDSIGIDGWAHIVYKGLTINLASGQSWTSDSSYIESDSSCSISLTQHDRISNFGFIPLSHIVQNR